MASTSPLTFLLDFRVSSCRFFDGLDLSFQVSNITASAMQDFWIVPLWAEYIDMYFSISGENAVLPIFFEAVGETLGKHKRDLNASLGIQIRMEIGK